MADIYSFFKSLFLYVLLLVIKSGEKRAHGAVAAVSIGGSQGESVTLTCKESSTSPAQWRVCDAESSCSTGRLLPPSLSSNNGTLTLNNVQFADEKYYSCSRNNEEMNRYRLFVMGKPQCTGKSSLTESETTTLTCTVQYTQGSTAPQIEWQSPHNTKKRRRKRATTPGIVTAPVEVTGEWHEDGAKRVCLVSLYGHSDQCTIVTSVTYSVTNVELMPRMAGRDAGEDVRCSANGNPRPSIKMSVEFNGTTVERETAQWRMMSKWAGHTVKVSCKASNMVNGVVVEEEDSREYKIRASNYTDPPLSTTEEPQGGEDKASRSGVSSVNTIQWSILFYVVFFASQQSTLVTIVLHLLLLLLFIGYRTTASVVHVTTDAANVSPLSPHDSSPYTANIGVTVVITLIVVLVVSALVVLGIVLKRRGSLPCVRRKRDNRSAKASESSSLPLITPKEGPAIALMPTTATVQNQPSKDKNPAA